MPLLLLLALSAHAHDHDEPATDTHMGHMAEVRETLKTTLGDTYGQPPADLTDGAHARYYSDAGRIEIIKSASAATACPPSVGASAKRRS